LLKILQHSLVADRKGWGGLVERDHIEISIQYFQVLVTIGDRILRRDKARNWEDVLLQTQSTHSRDACWLLKKELHLTRFS
jgi:hypothetical protein